MRAQRTRSTALVSLVCCTALVASGALATTVDQPTFVGDVAPILYDNCAGCHQPGEIAPMSLLSYNEVRPWARSIARVVKDKDMPPWDADPGYGPFSNDTSLSDAEIATITDWVAAGAPKGEGDMPTLPKSERQGEWALGEPDFVYTFDAYDVPGDGPDQFTVIPIPQTFDEDRWIKKVEVLPGDPSVVHHFILWQSDASGQNQQSWISGWAAGAAPNVFPEGTARLLKKGHALLGDFHYHPTGEATTDQTKIGIHFADPEEVEKEFVNLWVLNADFKIPAGDPNYGAKASYVFPQDVQIRSLTPHMHYRGKDMTYRAIYPDGREETLLSVSRYDFNWQTNYDFAEPVKMPAGTKIEVIAHWDNSPDNPANPDPSVDVTWGTASTDEMLIGFVDYVVDEGISPKPVSLVLGKLAELAEAYPGQVWRIDVTRDPAKGPEPSAVHLPKDGGPGGWYVQMGSLVLPAPIQEVVWDGNKVTAKAMIPGQDPTPLSGVVDESGALALSMGGGVINGTPAELEAGGGVIPN